MEYNKRRSIGMVLLIQKYRNKFEIDENINYYSFKDFLRAERKYIQYMTKGSIDKHASQSYYNHSHPSVIGTFQEQEIR